MDIIHYSNERSRLDKANYKPYFIFILNIFSSNGMFINLLLIFIFVDKELLNLNKAEYYNFKMLIFLYKL